MTFQDFESLETSKQKIPKQENENNTPKLLSSNTKSLSFMEKSSQSSSQSFQFTRHVSTHSKNPFSGNLKPSLIFNVIESDAVVYKEPNTLMRKSFGTAIKRREQEELKNTESSASSKGRFFSEKFEDQDDESEDETTNNNKQNQNNFRKNDKSKHESKKRKREDKAFDKKKKKKI